MAHARQPADRHLEVTSVAERHATIVTALGELDVASGPRLVEAVATALPQAGAATVVIDLAGVGFVDSSGLRALIESDRLAQAAGGRLVLARPGPPVTRLLDLTGLGEVLTVSEGTTAADVAGLTA